MGDQLRGGGTSRSVQERDGRPLLILVFFWDCGNRPFSPPRLRNPGHHGGRPPRDVSGFSSRTGTPPGMGVDGGVSRDRSGPCSAGVGVPVASLAAAPRQPRPETLRAHLLRVLVEIHIQIQIGSLHTRGRDRRDDYLYLYLYRVQVPIYVRGESVVSAACLRLRPLLSAATAACCQLPLLPLLSAAL